MAENNLSSLNFNELTAYVPGDYCIYPKIITLEPVDPELFYLYRCHTSTGPGEFDATAWTQLGSIIAKDGYVWSQNGVIEYKNKSFVEESTFNSYKNNADNTFVHKNGETETIKGDKTFNNTVSIDTGDINTTLSLKGIKLSNGVQSFKDIVAIDNNSTPKRIGGVRFEHSENNNRTLGLYVCDSNDSNKGGITISTKPDGTATNISRIALVTSTNAKNSDSNSIKNEIPTIGWVNDPNYSTNVIHRTGYETITELKTFIESSTTTLSGTYLNAIALKSSYVSDDVTPTDNQFTNIIESRDKNDKRLARIYTSKNKTSGNNGIAIQAWKGNTNYIIGINSSGATYAPVQAASGHDSNYTVGTGDNIATVHWVNNPTLSTNVVHRSDDENISGIKNFTTRFGLRNNGVLISRGTQSYTESTSGWTLEGGVHIYGPNDDQAYGALETIKDGNTTYTQINVRGRNGNWASNPIGVGIDGNNNTYTYAPTPTVSASGNTIATCGYINNKFQVVNSLPSNPDANTFYFIYE